MGRYTVTEGQNLYDVALHLTGSVEGIVDLLICNPTLSLADTLRSGDTLVYTDGFVIDADVVAKYRRENIVPAGGERSVYPKYPTGVRRLWFTVDATQPTTAFALSGSGRIEIDWGDNSPLETVVLGASVRTLSHRFDNTVTESRRVRLYGDFTLRSLDLSESGARRIRLSGPLSCERFSLCGGSCPVDFLPLLDGVFRMDLRRLSCDSLLPVAECRELMTLDLSGAEVSRPAVDAFLIALVRRHYGRRSAEITLTTAPYGEYREPARDSELNYVIATGMEAVWLLTHEEAWNEGSDWVIHIGDKTYRYERPTQPTTEPEPEPEPNSPSRWRPTLRWHHLILKR